MNTLEEILSLYSDRQVILNYYEDEELIRKEGYHFDKISFDANNINFMKAQKIITTIDRAQFDNFTIMDSFKNYYILKNSNSYIEIYFP